MCVPKSSPQRWRPGMWLSPVTSDAANLLQLEESPLFGDCIFSTCHVKMQVDILVVMFLNILIWENKTLPSYSTLKVPTLLLLFFFFFFNMNLFVKPQSPGIVNTFKEI